MGGTQEISMWELLLALVMDSESRRMPMAKSTELESLRPYVASSCAWMSAAEGS